MSRYTWIGGGGDDDWSNPLNWSNFDGGGPGVPGAGDVATISNASSIFAGDSTVAIAIFQDDSINGDATTVLTGTLTTTSDLTVVGYVDDDTQFTLEVDPGGELDAASPSEGFPAVTIDNSGAIFVNGGTFNETQGGVQVGETDDGYLMIADDGVAKLSGLTLGDENLGSGTVEVTGAGSKLTVNANAVEDGYRGLGALDVDDSAQVKFDDDLFLGVTQGANGQVNVGFDGAKLTVAMLVDVGEAGFGSVDVKAGGGADFGSLDIAVQSKSGDPTTFAPSYVSVVGAPLVAARPLVGVAPGGVATLTVSGAITVGDAGYGELYVGQFGSASGASLDIAAQSTSGAYAGDYPTGASSNVVGDPSYAEVTDDGSLTIGGAIVVGDAGYGELSVSDDGTVSGASLVVANLASSGAFAGTKAAGPDAPNGNPSFVTVDDATLTISGAATIGDDGYGALYIEASGAMTAASLTVASQTSSGAYGADHAANAANSGSYSLIDLDDGSLTIADEAIVGEAGYGGALVTDGATFSVGSLDIAAMKSSGDAAVHDSSYVEVTDDASTLIVTGDAVVGDQGYGALRDFDGAKTTIGGKLTIAAHATSGSVADAAPDFVAVDGTGSSIAVTGSTIIGGGGYGALNATNGGSFSTASITMANGVLTADALSLVTVGTGTAASVNGVEVESTGTISGTGAITGAIANYGEISVGSGMLYLDGQIGGTGDITFAPTSGLATLKLDDALAPGQGGTLANSLKNFGDNDALDLSDMTFFDGATAKVVGSTLTVTSGGDIEHFALSGSIAASYYVYDDSSGDSIVTDSAAPPPCYVRGTRILTARGPVAVEALAIGDAVITASGASRPIRWLGHRSVDVRRHPDPDAVRPVRVSAHAFGEGAPLRDLWLSPDHCIAWDGALMPISSLINGRSVARRDVERVQYWHVELDAHDVILAECLAAESYLDSGNRAAFANGAAFVEAQPDFRPRHWADTCLPLHLEGPPVVAAKARLIARLAEQGLVVNGQADAHVVIDGLRIEPIRLNAMRLVFALPPGGREIALRSNVFVPAHTLADSDDLRELGLCLGRLQIDGAPAAWEHDDGAGWRPEFDNGRFSHRWTKATTPLPAGARIVIVDLAGAGYYWAETETGAAALRA